MLEWLGFDDDSNLPRFQSLLRLGDRFYWDTDVAPMLDMEAHVAEIAVELATRDGAASVLLNARNTNPGDSESRIDLVIFPAEDRRNYELELLSAWPRRPKATRATSPAVSRRNTPTPY